MSLDVYLYAPNVCPHCGESLTNEENCVFSANVTHNLVRMAEAATLYTYLWRPDELEINRADQLITPLRDGLAALVADPTLFAQYNPANGWGNYDSLLRFVRDYLAACEANPAARVSVSR